jgi:hypothetical protein
MIRVGRIILALVPLCLIVTIAAQAGTDPSQAFRDLGLEGVWSPDCRRAPSIDNPRVFWWPRDSGPFTHAVTFDGKTFALNDTVGSAVRLNNSQIRFVVVRNTGPALTVTVEWRGTKIHTLASAGADGTVYYRNGIETATGRPSLLDERCDIAPPLS